MTVYYNEINPFAAKTLRKLIAAGVIAPGDVDERDMREVPPDDLQGYAQCHFCAGLGGWSYALRLAGVPDTESVWTASLPCQPFSVAGKQAGFADPRHLWPSFRNTVAERKPPRIFGEQSAAATDWVRLVRGDLEALDYAVGIIPVEAASAGAPHKRDRFWIFADAEWGEERDKPRCWPTGRMGREQQPMAWDRDWESALRQFRVVDDGLSYGVAATDLARNAIVPQLAAKFIQATMN